MPSATFIQTRIDATEAAIVATEAALTALIGGAQSYRLDTGQGAQWVTRVNLDELRRLLAGYWSLLEELENKLERAVNGPASAYVIPRY